MKYLYRGHRKNLHETVGYLSETYGADCSYRTGEFRLVLAKRRKEEQYAFIAEVRETDEGCIIEGEIGLTGQTWKWYDYFFSVLLCLLIVPVLVLLATPALLGTSYASQAGADSAVLPVFSPSKKAQRKKLSRIMALFTEEIA